MSAIKKLAGQTAIYGIPSILGRFLSYLLVPLYTNTFLPGEYGTVNVFYSYASFLMVVLTYGMETAFFRFYELENDKGKVYNTSIISLILTSVLFILLVSIYAGPIARLIDYPKHRDYVIWFAWILTLDALSAIPFARLRALNKSRRFASIKMAGILINISLNLFFILLCPYIIKSSPHGSISHIINIFYRQDWGIEYIFISNLVASCATLLLLYPEIAAIRWKTDPAYWKKMFMYAFPLLFAGMAGIVNETFDRLLLRYLLPKDIATYEVGIYAANYKISILMTIFIQAYRYAAEPFFFAQSKEADAKKTYARIMDYFIITVSLIFLATMVYLDDIILRFRFIGVKYWSGRGVIPILMLANLFLGVYYNLSIWYKLSGKTIWGAWFSAIGAVITLVLNFWWIPLSHDHLIHGYLGSAWATFICYGSMMIISYIVGQKYYPIGYNMVKFFGYLGFAVLLYFISTRVQVGNIAVRFLFHTALIMVFSLTALLIEKPSVLRKHQSAGPDSP
ncbi:MAG TPA: oligosaccharide flippase family protein [Bacteroidales bacterium]|nr:oligosaccharide flippase family protein [Bacteroidales bacterium]